MIPTDLLGRTIEVGDIVAWPTSRGHSISMTVGRIEKINFKRPLRRYKADGEPYLSRSEFEKCDADHPDAAKYTVSAKPMKFTGFYWSHKKYNPNAPQGQRFEEDPNGPKAVTIQKVENIVRVASVGQGEDFTCCGTALHTDGQAHSSECAG